MTRIGLIIAVEIDVFEKRFGTPADVLIYHNQTITKYRSNQCELYVVLSGAGQIAAASAVQMLISICDVEMVLNFGVVGGLTEDISKHRVCVVTNVVHYDFDTSVVDNCEVGRHLDYPSIYIPTDTNLVAKAITVFPELMPVVCASGNKFVADINEKEHIHKSFGTEIVDMESAGIVLTCNRNGIPCLLIKMVADGITGGAAEFSREFMKSSEACLDVLTELIAQV